MALEDLQDKTAAPSLEDDAGGEMGIGDDPENAVPEDDSAESKSPEEAAQKVIDATPTSPADLIAVLKECGYELAPIDKESVKPAKELPKKPFGELPSKSGEGLVALRLNAAKNALAKGGKSRGR